MRRYTTKILILGIFLLGVGLLCYPFISNRLYETVQSRVRTDYEKELENISDEDMEQQRELAREYNENLLKGSVVLTDPFDPAFLEEMETEPYSSLVNPLGTGMMGYVEIPRIFLYLPVYHGTDSRTLEKGIGHLQNTSLPVGGENTHAVLTGHTGLSGKKLFTDLTELEEGDVFYLHMLGETLAYQVDQISIVEPEETDLLTIEPGRDLVTLLTCYPYGVNSHRLLVRGSRVPYEEAVEQQEDQEEKSGNAASLWEEEYQRAILLCIFIYTPLTLLLILLFLWKRKRKRKKRKRREDGG